MNEPNEAHPRYPNVFRPLALGPIEVPNRFYFAPHGSALAVGSMPAEELTAYSSERVRNGGAGLVIIATAVHERARTRQPSAYPEENIPAFTAYADGIHGAGGKAFVESLYWWGGGGHWQPLSPGGPAFGPSVRQFGYQGRQHSTREMSRADIREVIDAHRQSARNLRQAGIDGIMLHGSHGAIIEQFLSPYFNERADEYGGDLQRRLRFLFEIIEATREGAGEGMALGMRLNCDEMMPTGYTTDGAREIIAAISERGLLDFFDLDLAIEPQQLHYGMPTHFTEPHVYRSAVAEVRSAAGNIPVLSVLGRVTSMTDAEAAIAEGVCDMVGAARQLIAEPEFVQNARAGHEERSRVCIACNWCMSSSTENAQGCTINPASYRERFWGVDSLVATARPSTVVVVGGGPAGMEAARVSARLGHRVVLFERGQRLGGALAYWAELPGRETYGRAVDWWCAELDRLGVEVRLGAEADPGAVLGESPDAVIVATGSHYSVGGRSLQDDRDLPGFDLPHVVRPEDILAGGVLPAGRVAVLDAEGFHTGVGIAEMLAANGATVSHISPNFVPVQSRLVNNFEIRFIVQRLAAAGVSMVPTTWARVIQPGAVILYDVYTEREWRQEFDAVVLVGGRIPDDAIARELEGRVGAVYTIGDALSVRTLAAATFEGQKFARLVGEADRPATTTEAYFRRDRRGISLAVAGTAPKKR